MRTDNRIPGLSAADLVVLDAIAACHIATHKALRELAHVVAVEHGIRLDKPQPDKPRRRRHRYGHVTRHAPGNVTAEVVNTETGQTRRFRFTRTNDGGIDVEEE